ncbi:flagellar biosynthesis protein [Bacteroides pectinophilus CAG:437]|jgi:flagellar biosynthesis protein|uniref:Flagellar biosynthesis protein n=1 Tax=Bacteroides pectinophilus CAG:437 TaxID=1263051 RepID=R7ABY6_9FIRM|nr:flagellar biosynthesis protein [Bacteroides pectinophilus CAG:437]
MNRSPMNNPKDDNLNNSNNSNNSNKVAVALSYEAGEQAPRIIASGRGYLADQIIEKSKESDVPVYQDNKLASTLAKLEIGDMIPPELYGVVAEILVFVDDMDRLRAKVKKK